MYQSNDFQITLPSNSSNEIFPDNKPNSFKTNLAFPLELDGDWEVAIIDIQYPHNWNNVLEGELITFIEGCYDESGRVTSGPLFDLVQQNIRKTKDFKSARVWHVSIQPGYYQSVKDIGERIVQKSKVEYSRSRVSVDPPEEPIGCQLDYHFDPVHQQSTFECPRTIMCFEKTDTLLQKMGFKPVGETDRYFFFPLTVRSTMPTYMESFTSLYVYSDIILPQLVGDAYVKLMGVVPIIGNFGQTSHWGFNPPYYLPISRGYISSIEIELRTDTGDLLPVRSGKVVCRLHFRKCVPGK